MGRAGDQAGIISKMATSAQRILYVEGNVDGTIGGSYYSLLYLVSGLDRGRYQPIVVFARDHALIARYKAVGAQVMLLAPPRPMALPGPLSLLSKAVNFYRSLIAEPLRLATLLQREKIALVHLNNSIIRNHPWMVAACFARVPCITHERGINPAYPRLTVMLAKRLAAIVCISRAVYENFHSLGLGHLRLVTIYNGLDPAEMKVTRSATEIRLELGIAPQQRLIGIVGNIKPWKGQEVVIRAMAELKDRHTDIVCLLIGDSSPQDSHYREKLARLVRQLGLDGRVVVTGFRLDVANYVCALDILVHASVKPEPFGRVLLEGMALCKPLVASGGGAVPEIVVDRVTGLLFEPGSSTSLARCLDDLLTDPGRAAMMGAAGRRRLEVAFSIESNIQATQELYRGILGPSSAVECAEPQAKI